MWTAYSFTSLLIFKILPYTLHYRSLVQEQVDKALAEVWELANNGAATQADWAKLEQLKCRLDEGRKVVQQDLADQLIRAEEARQEAERQAAEEAAASERAVRDAEEAASAAAASAGTIAGTAVSSSLQTTPLPTTQLPAVPVSSLPTESYFPYEYHEIKEFKARYISDVDLGSDKKLKSELQQAVNTPLNAISAVSRDHLRDKLHKLSQLLAGETVEVKDTRVCAARHPSGIKFCMAMLAKRIVKQGMY